MLSVARSLCRGRDVACFSRTDAHRLATGFSQRFRSSLSFAPEEGEDGFVELANGKLKLLCAAEGNWAAPKPTIPGFNSRAEQVAVVRSALTPLDASWASLNQVLDALSRQRGTQLCLSPVYIVHRRIAIIPSL